MTDWGIWLACMISFAGGLAIGAYLMRGYLLHTRADRRTR